VICHSIQARTLEHRKSQLEKDKQQLMDTISELDTKKKEEIIKAHGEVNEVRCQCYHNLDVLLLGIW